METETHTKSVQSVHAGRLYSFGALQTKRFFVFLLGLMIMSYGIVCVVKANFGVSPWDVLHLGIVKNSSLSFGRVQQLVGVAIMICACIMQKKLPTFGAIANMILVGEFCDLILRWELVPHWEHAAARIFLFVGGLMISGFGTGIYIQSQLGAGPRDWLMLALHEKTGWAIRWVRTMLEVMAVLLGLWLGGPFYAGTIVFSLTIGHVTELGLWIAKRLFGRFTERRAVS
jgi:uncharacterized membrane protein YczE